MLDLSDVTFTIPLKYDSEDRANNLKSLIVYLENNVKTNVILFEQGTKPYFKEKLNDIIPKHYVYLFWETDQEIFYRTKILNIMCKRASTPIIVNYDCDVVLSVKQYEEATNLIRSNELDLCTAFDTYTYNVPKSLHQRIVEEKNIDWLTQKMCECPHRTEVAKGGVVFWNKEKFIQAGMENENIISWGPEDQERVYRAQVLGYKWGRAKGTLFHLDHIRTPNSNAQHPFFTKNELEFEKIKSMSREQLLEYVNQWKWNK